MKLKEFSKESFAKLLADYELEDAYQWVCSRTLHQKGYHTLYHMEVVTHYAELLLRQYNVPKEDRYPVLIAALFHDVGHVGKFGPDSVNIERAIELYQLFVSEVRGVYALYSRSVPELIRSTQYPYDSPPKGINAACLRSADLMMLNEPDAYEWAFVRLYSEYEKSVEEPNKEEYWTKQIDFMINLPDLIPLPAARYSINARMYEISLKHWHKRFVYGDTQTSS